MHPVEVIPLQNRRSELSPFHGTVYWLKRIPEAERREGDDERWRKCLPAYKLSSLTDAEKEDELNRALLDELEAIAEGEDYIRVPVAFRDGTFSHTVKMTRTDFANFFDVDGVWSGLGPAGQFLQEGVNRAKEEKQTLGSRILDFLGAKK